MLHPWHKLAYFKTAGWEDEWINAAENIVRAEFNHTYAYDGGGDVDMTSKHDGKTTDKDKVSSDFLLQLF